MADDFNNTTDFGVVKILMLKGEKGDTGNDGADGISGDYAGLINKPSINGVQINGNQTSDDLGLASATGLQVLSGRVVQNESDISNLQTGLQTANGNISTLQTNLATARTDIDNLQSDVPLIQSDLQDLQSKMDEEVLTLRTRLTSLDDLNDSSLVNGIYYYTTDSVPANAYYSNASILEIVGNGGTAILQRLTRFGVAGKTAWRVRLNGTWLDWTEVMTKEPIGTNKTFTLDTAGYLTTSSRTIRFSIPAPIESDGFVVQVLAIAVRHIGGGYAYYNSSTDGTGTNIPLGASPRQIYTDTISGEPELELGVQSIGITKNASVMDIIITFNRALRTAETGGSTVINNTPVGIQVQMNIITGTKEQLQSMN